MSAAHPTAFTLERLAVDDLPADEAAAAQAHVAACAQCRGFIDGLRAMAARRLAAVPPAAFVTGLVAQRRRQRRRWAAVATAAGSALVAASLVLWVPRAGVRLRGGGGFVLERERGGAVERLGSDARVRTGDKLQVLVTLPRPAPVDAWFVDARGRVDALLDAPLPMPAGERALPGSVTVDAPCVDGWLVVASGAAASPAAEAALRARVAGGIDIATRVPPGVPDGARVARLTCE